MTDTKKSHNQFDVIKKRVAKKLQGFTADFPNNLNNQNWKSHKPELKDVPVPELILFTLRNLMEWRWSGHGEKVRWSLYGSVSGEPIILEYRKFGFVILYLGSGDICSRIVGQLKSALQEVEKFLESFAEYQVSNGDFLIVNRFGEFDERYRFFRGLAGKAYSRADRPPRASNQKNKDQFSGTLLRLNHSMKARREGFFYSTAMVDSYFSALEHRLVLLRAFTGKTFEVEGGREFFALDWDEKLKFVLPVADDLQAQKILGHIRRIKERIRNPFAHGGFERDRGSLFFHLPSVGAVPANFTRFGDSVRFSFIPIESDDYGAVCEVFDQIDTLLSTGFLARPHKLMDAGIDPSFDSVTLEEYNKVLNADESVFEGFIERWSDEWMRHANMDY